MVNKDNQIDATAYRRGQSDRILLLGQMAAGILHDAGNQMMLIQGALGLAQYAPGDASYGPTMKAAQQAADTVGELLKEILSFTRPEKGRNDPKAGVYGDDEIMLMLPLIRSSLGGQIEVIEQLDSEDDRIRISAVQFQNVLLNLLVNARNAMKGQGTITLKTQNVKRDGQPFWQLMVQDDGPGIRPEQLDSIFEPYFTTTGQGHGLGLMRCRMLVEQAGGHIIAGNGPDTGACFTITLPVMDEPLAGREEPELCLGSGRIAVLMTRQQQDLISSMLRALGYTPVNMLGLMDLKRLEQDPARLVLIDETKALSAYLKAIPENCPILAIGQFDTVMRRRDPRVHIVERPITLLRLSHLIQELACPPQEARPHNGNVCPD